MHGGRGDESGFSCQDRRQRQSVKDETEVSLSMYRGLEPLNNVLDAALSLYF